MTAPKERPILFSAPMVRALLDGRKTQTRRIVKPQPHAGVRRSPFVASGLEDGHGRGLRCQFGVPGERLWVRETTAEGWTYGGGNAVVWYRADGQARFKERPDMVCDYAPMPDNLRWRPSIHMPRWASRITLEITDVRVQRLQEISEADAMAEGIGRYDNGTFGLNDPGACMGTTAVVAYMRLWESINGPGSWEASPWVWALTFRRVER